MKKKTIEQTFPDVIADVRYNADKLYSRIDDSAGPNACWPISGPKHRQGYGMIGGMRIATEKRIMQTVHRLLLKIKTNSDLAGLDAVHTCGNMTCCNPSHLFAGTAADILNLRLKRPNSNFGKRLGTISQKPRKQHYQYGIQNIIDAFTGKIDEREFGKLTGLKRRRAKKVYSDIKAGRVFKWAKFMAEKESK